jgi:protein TonB
MRVTVGKNGQVESAQALEGPAELQRAALEAIRKWEFQPFLVLGEPVEIEGTMQITFTLG